MAEFRNVPGEMEMAQLDRRLFDDLARGCLPGLLGQHNGRDGPGFGLGISLANQGGDFLLLDIAGDHIEDVVGRVLLVIVGKDVFRLEFVENVGVADDRETVGAPGVGAFKEAPAGAAARIIYIHVHLAHDDILLLG